MIQAIFIGMALLAGASGCSTLGYPGSRDARMRFDEIVRCDQGARDQVLRANCATRFAGSVFDVHVHSIQAAGPDAVVLYAHAGDSEKTLSCTFRGPARAQLEPVSPRHRLRLRGTPSRVRAGNADIIELEPCELL